MQDDHRPVDVDESKYGDCTDARRVVYGGRSSLKRAIYCVGKELDFPICGKGFRSKKSRLVKIFDGRIQQKIIKTTLFRVFSEEFLFFCIKTVEKRNTKGKECLDGKGRIT